MKNLLLNKKLNNLLILVIVALMITVFFFQSRGIVKAAEQKEQSKKKQSKKEQQPRVTMTLFETDLREALNEISLQTGVNIIPDQTVHGVVTADLKNVPLEKALRTVLIGGGYTYRKIEDFYLVGLPDPKSNTFSKLSEVEVVSLKHTNAQEVFKVLPSFLDPYVKGDPKDNIITISAPPQQTERIKELINKVDKPQKKVKVKVVVTEVNSEKVKELGTNLLEHKENTAASKSISYNTNDNLLVIEDEYYGKLLTELNVLQEEQKAEIRANPRLLVSDKEKAELFVGDRQVLVLTSENNDFSSRVEKIEVGVGLQVVADIISENEINLKLAPKVSRFVDEERPDLVVKRNSVSTTLQLKSGQTVMLAGMTLEDDSNYNKGIPILKDIPLVRWLFSTNTTRKNKRELLIFVTPVIQ